MTSKGRKKKLELMCKYWHRGMAKTNYRKHKGRQRLESLEDALLTVTEGEWLYVEATNNIPEDTCITCSRCGQYHSVYIKCK